MQRAGPVEEWPGLAAALAQSEREAREAREAAQLDERAAIEDVREAERREQAEIEEALRLVEAAMRRERDEFEEALRAVALADGGNEVRANASPAWDAPPLELSPARGHASPADSSTFDSGVLPASVVQRQEQQLAALMELGFHAAVAAPHCDGVRSIEEIVEELTGEPAALAADDDDAAPATPRGRAASGPSRLSTGKSSRRWGVARRFLPGAS